MKHPRIILADDSVILLDAIKNSLEKDFDVVGTFTDGRTLVNCAADLKPDLIVLEVSMPQMNGLMAAARLKEILPKVKLIFLTMNLDPHVAREAFRLGASGYVAKHSPVKELLKALDSALVGRRYISDLIVEDGFENFFLHGEKRVRNGGPLTERQKEVLQLLAEGHSMKEAAYMLKISPRTVAFHKYSIMEQLHLHNTADLVRFALRTPLMGAVTGSFAAT